MSSKRGRTCMACARQDLLCMASCRPLIRLLLTAQAVYSYCSCVQQAENLLLLAGKAAH